MAELNGCGKAGEAIVVIGYGNTLRGDDGVGRQVAEAVAGWNLSQVQALSVQQLTPELAEAVANARFVLFVDARPVDCGPSVSVQSLKPGTLKAPLGHSGDPRALLTLAQTVYGRCPHAYLITVPGLNFELGEGLTRAAHHGKAVALREIRAFVQDLAPADPVRRQEHCRGENPGGSPCTNEELKSCAWQYRENC
jgi:hydrogenase maturation protease